MKNLIPHFIHEQHQDGTMRGAFPAAVLFVDLSGFTGMTEAHMDHGKEAAESLAAVMKSVFTPLIHSIYAHGGFITGFTGDAFTAVFPISPPGSGNGLGDADQEGVVKNTLAAAQTIQQNIRDNPTQTTPYGAFPFAVKIGMAAGQVEWGIIESPTERVPHAYYFKGAGIDDAVQAEHQADKGDLILSAAVAAQLTNHIDVDAPGNYVRVTGIHGELPRPQEITRAPLAASTVSRFLPPEFASADLPAEFRPVATAFISLQDVNAHEQLDTFLTQGVFPLQQRYGGYLNGIDFGDKGCNILLLFGAPVAHENDPDRLLRFLLELKELTHLTWRAGVTFRPMYTGPVGSELRLDYSCYGRGINLAARLMMKADWGDIRLADKMRRHVERMYHLAHIADLAYKGIAEPIPTYRLIDRKSIVSQFYTGKMVGREQETTQLNEWLTPIFNQKFGGIVYVYGPAGIGKSRLVNEALDRRDDVQYFTLQTDALLKTGFNPFIYALKQYFQQADADKSEQMERFESIYDSFIQRLEKTDHPEIPAIIKELTRTKSFIGGLIGLRWEGSLYEQLEPKLRYENTLFGLKTFFTAQSLLQPTVIFLEDLHWLDDDSQQAFATMTRVVSDFPFLIIAGARFHDDGTTPVLYVDKDVRQQELIVSALAPEVMADLMTPHLGAPPDNDLAAFIGQRTEGNPFYTEQFCLYLKESGLLELKPTPKSPPERGLDELPSPVGYYTLTSTTIDIPDRINAVLIARIDRLTRHVRELVQTAAVIGREFETSLLMTIIHLIDPDYPLDEFFPYLETGEQEQVWTPLQEIRYIFRHALLRDTAYEMQMTERRRRVHQLIAETIETFNPDEGAYFGLIAEHYDRAEVTDRAIEYLEKAGDYAKEQSQNADALRLYDRLLELLPPQAAESRIDTLHKKGQIFDLTGRWAEAVVVWTEGIQLAKQAQDVLREAKLTNMSGWIHTKKGDYDRAMGLCLSAKALAEAAGDDEGRKVYATTLNNMGIIYANKGDYDQAFSYYQRSLQIREEIGNRPGIAASLGNIGSIYNNKGEYDQAFSYQQRSLQIKEEIGDRQGMANSLGNIGNIYNNKGDYDQALSYLQRSLQIKEEIGDRQGMANSLGNIGNIYNNKGDYDQALSYYQRSLQIEEEIGDWPGMANSLGNMGLIYAKKRDYNQAFSYYQRSLQIFEEIGYRSGMASSFGNMGLIFDDKGDYDQALSYHQRSLQIEEEIGNRQGMAVSLSNMGIIYYNKGDYNQALSYYQRSLQIFEEIGYRRGMAASLNNIGEIYHDKGDYDQAFSYYQRSLQIREEIGAKGEMGENYSSMAWVYVAQKQYKLALETARLHLQNIAEVGRDVEHGRTHLAIALVLAQTLRVSKTLRVYLDEIAEMTGLPETAAAYFEKAIHTASEINYLQTLIPALYEYGRYLMTNCELRITNEESKTNYDLGIEKIKEAKAKAEAAGRMGELRKIEALCQELGVQSLDFAPGEG